MNYDIRPLDIFDLQTQKDVSRFLNIIFEQDFSRDELQLKTYTKSKAFPSLYMGAYYDDELIGFNCFISHDLIYNGEIVNCYQTCLSSVHPKHRGTIFISLIEEAKKILRQRGAGFIFGWPSRSSHLVYTKSLKFRDDFLGIKVNIPASTLLSRAFFIKWSEEKELSVRDAFLQNDFQLLRLKQQKSGDTIKIIHDENLIWGKIRTRKVGFLNLAYFSVGGMIIANPYLLQNTFAKLIREHAITWVQVILHHSHTMAHLFIKPIPSRRFEPLIVYDLNARTSERTKFNFMDGIKDVY